jgi:hypothetical protein
MLFSDPDHVKGEVKIRLQRVLVLNPQICFNLGTSRAVGLRLPVLREKGLIDSDVPRSGSFGGLYTYVGQKARVQEPNGKRKELSERKGTEEKRTDERKDRKQMTKDRQSPGAGGRCISVSNSLHCNHPCMIVLCGPNPPNSTTAPAISSFYGL